MLLQSDRAFVEASRCGGGFGTTPYVCCSSDTGFVIREPRTQLVALARQEPELDANERAWLRQIFRGNFLSTTTFPERAVQQPKTKSALLPEPPTCGGEFIDNRIYGGRDTELYEFPWMAFLEYTNAGKYNFYLNFF